MKLVGVKVAVVGRPVPVRVATRVGLAVVLVLTVRVPVRAPLVSGAKTTEMVQEAPAARVAGQALVWVKLPAMVTPLTVMAMALVLVRVKVWAADRPPPA